MDVELAIIPPTDVPHRGSSEADIIRRDVPNPRQEFNPSIVYHAMLWTASMIVIGLGIIEITAGVTEPNKTTCTTNIAPIGIMYASNIGIAFGTIDLFLVVCTICDYILSLKNINKCSFCQKFIIIILASIFVLASTVVGWLSWSSMNISCSNFLRFAIFFHSVMCSIVIVCTVMWWMALMIKQFW